MQGDVEAAPGLSNAVKNRLQLALPLHVERREDRRLQLLCQRLDVGLGLVVEVRDCQVGAEFAKGAGTAVGDRVLVGDADHQRLLAREDRAGSVNAHAATLLFGPASTRRVWRAMISSSLVGTNPRGHA